MTIEGTVAVVTGGASGIGDATARVLADRGTLDVIADLDEDRAVTVAADLGGLGAGSLVTIASVTAMRSTPLHADGPGKAALVQLTADPGGRVGRVGRTGQLRGTGLRPHAGDGGGDHVRRARPGPDGVCGGPWPARTRGRRRARGRVSGRRRRGLHHRDHPASRRRLAGHAVVGDVRGDSPGQADGIPAESGASS